MGMREAIADPAPVRKPGMLATARHFQPARGPPPLGSHLPRQVRLSSRHTSKLPLPMRRNRPYPCRIYNQSVTSEMKIVSVGARAGGTGRLKNKKIEMVREKRKKRKKRKRKKENEKRTKKNKEKRQEKKEKNGTEKKTEHLGKNYDQHNVRA